MANRRVKITAAAPKGLHVTSGLARFKACSSWQQGEDRLRTRHASFGICGLVGLPEGARENYWV